MIDVIAVVSVLVLITVLLWKYFNVRFLTSLTVASIAAWITSGFFVQTATSTEVYYSDELAAKKLLYSFISTFAVLLLMLHVFVATYRESGRRHLLQ